MPAPAALAASKALSDRSIAVGAVAAEVRAAAGFDAAQSRGVFVGVNAYTAEYGVRPPDLRSCANDAVDLAAAFWDLGLIEPSGIALALSGAPSKPESIASLDRLKKAGAVISSDARRDTLDALLTKAANEAGVGGILFFTWSAHGFEAGGVQYLTPENFYSATRLPSAAEIMGRAVSEATLSAVAQSSPAARRVLFFDACRETKALSPGMPQLIADTAGVITLYAVTSGRMANDGSRNGEFTGLVLEALTSPAPPETLHADRHGNITIGTLLDYLGTAGRIEDTKILEMPLRRHPREFALASDRTRATSLFTAAKRLDLEAPRQEQELDDIGIGALENALLTSQGPGLVQEIDALLGDEASRANYRNRRSFAGYWKQIQHSLADVVPTSTPAQPSGKSNTAAREAYDELLSVFESRKLDRGTRIAQLKDFVREWSGTSTSEDARVELDRLVALDRLTGEAQSEFASLLADEMTDVLTVSQAKSRRDAWAEYLSKYEATGHKVSEAREKREYYAEWEPVSPTSARLAAGTVRSVDVGGGVLMNLVHVRGGTFTMGSPKSEKDRDSDEGPQTQVTLTKDFWLGETEVTQAQWRAVMGSDPPNLAFPGKPQNPVERVSWGDALDFCRTLTAKAPGWSFGLPSEAQWEYACRAGSSSRYCHGDSESGLEEYAWYGSNSGGTTQAVKSKKANAWGLYDMHGNVYEWCSDWYADKLPGGSVTDPADPASGSFRISRGGGWDDQLWYCRSANRGRSGPDSRGNDLGFRVMAAVHQ